jgi:hypothetical protein
MSDINRRELVIGIAGLAIGVAAALSYSYAHAREVGRKDVQETGKYMSKMDRTFELRRKEGE